MNNVVSHLPTSDLYNKPTQKRPVTNENISILHSGDIIYRMGDRLDGIYLVNSGAVKLFRTSECGDQQIVGFYMPGELIGLDALADGVSRSTAVALDTSNISLIPFSAVLSSDQEFGKIELIRRIGTTLIRDNDLIMMLSQRTADRRLAWFLVEFSDRLAERGIFPGEFTLPMTRTDISVFLGLAVETVCRELARFCEAGLVRKNRRRLYLLDIEALRQIASGNDLEAIKSNKLNKGTPKNARLLQIASGG